MNKINQAKFFLHIRTDYLLMEMVVLIKAPIIQVRDFMTNKWMKEGKYIIL